MNAFESKIAAELPPRPRLCLRVGLAGNRTIPQAMVVPIKDRLIEVLTAMSERLAFVWGNRDEEGSRVNYFYCDKQRPLLRLVTGLAEGADSLAADALAHVEQNSQLAKRVDIELAAILPCDLKTYKNLRHAEFKPDLDRYAARSSYILELDGICVKPSPDTPSDKKRRHNAYRAQAAFLLRHSDLMVIVIDPTVNGQPGGTLETLREALLFGLPVAFVNAADATIRLIDPEDDLMDVLEGDSPTPSAQADWQNRLARSVSAIVAGPDVRPIGVDKSKKKVECHQHLLEDYFDKAELPPMAADSQGKHIRRKSWRERIWSQLDKWLRPPDIPGQEPQHHPGFETYTKFRSRATALNYDASGLYRGTFLENYVLAVAAVMLATLCLAMIGYAPGSTYVEKIAGVLLVLACVKFFVVRVIYRNTDQAKEEDWNQKAVDYRYLAERLRSLIFLSSIGSFQPPYVAPPEYASRVFRQSLADWLADAIARSVSPAQVLTPPRAAPVASDAARGPAMLRIDTLAAAQTLRDAWVDKQITYHTKNEKIMEGLHLLLERWGRRLSLTVVRIVGMDIALLIVEGVFHPDEKLSVVLHYISVALLVLTAALPAAVASLYGITFQSECRRLFERSAMISDRLKGRKLELDRLIEQIGLAQNGQGDNMGAWSAKLLCQAETIARDLMQEVGEWSVLYTREVPETG